ncbi:MAG: peptidoglycan DD-metalloendopeptidase family protein [Candidatus Fermentibacteraceae bacterium]|nr:peptidoglycan DD-metalloendopeptidase family protein [Candidatus Fermentibacteraceae bacterium]
MRKEIKTVLVFTTLLAVLNSGTYANDPDPNTPWPVAFALSGMNVSHTLMNSYGDLNGSWESSLFHGGIDIDATTGDPDCSEVRCVDDGFVTVIDSVEIEGSDVEYEWIIIICDELGGVVENGWSYGHLTDPEVSYEQYVPEGQLLGYMNENVSSPHLHFMWNDWDDNHMAEGNPLVYLDHAPLLEEGYTWEFDPEEYDHRYFFLPDMSYSDWEPYTVAEFFAMMLDDSDLSGNVDFFFGVGLRGDGETGGEGDGSNDLAPQQIKWDIIREYPTGDQAIDSRYVVDFDCWLSNEPESDSRAQMLYFRKSMNAMYGFDALLYCLSNCTDAEDWDGINTIDERSWNTDSDCEEDGSTENPVLAMFPDGPYRLDVLLYSFDEDYTYPASIDVELHNFDPVVEKVVLSCEGNTVWEAYWTADGLTPVLNNPVDAGVLPDRQLDITVVFSEPMDTTSVTVTAGNDSPYNDITASDAGLDWSWTNCPEESEYKDTWHGVFEDLSGLTGGRITLSIQASDHDANGLMDPSIPCADGTDYNDTHHGFSMMGMQDGWPVTLEDVAYSSPVLADVDEDGDLDVIIQSIDGHVHVIDDDGSYIGDWNSGGWVIDCISSPAVVDIDGGSPEILSVYAFGCFAKDISGTIIADWVMGDPPTAPGYYPSKSSPVVEDVDFDGYPEIVLCRHLSNETNNEGTVFLYEHDTGRGIETWDRNLEESLGGSSVITTPSVCDVNNDGEYEVVVCTAQGYLPSDNTPFEIVYNSAVYILDSSDGSDVLPPLYYNCWFHASPVVADVDDDGVKEIILGTSGGSTGNRILVISGNSNTEEHYWDLDGAVNGPVAIGDIDNDGHPDIVAGVKGGIIECWSGETYNDVLGFPVSIDDDPGSGPSVADIDGDLDLEIIVGTVSGNLYAINHDGTICSGFPINFGNGAYGQVAIGNIDDDSGFEMVLADNEDPLVYCYDLGENSFPALMPWRQFQHDSWHTGCYDADYTIPEPPTDLWGTIEYLPMGSGEVELHWDLSINDPYYSPTPEEPADVIAYSIHRSFPPGQFTMIGRTHAGVGTYTDIYPGQVGPVVRYAVTASDGTNESEYSNDIRFPTRPSDLISVGCSVSEVWAGAMVSPVTGDRVGQASLETSSRTERGTAETSASTPRHIPDAVALLAGNPDCLTDGSTVTCYRPSPGAEAVVIDLGEGCKVSSISLESSSGSVTEELLIQGTSSVRTEYPRTDCPSILIEVSGCDREYSAYDVSTARDMEDIRYVRVYGAAGLTEISVYGTRSSSAAEALPVEVARSSDGGEWLFTIPMVPQETSEEALVKIFDVSGRLVWSGMSETGDVLRWDGRSNGSPVPSGVYLLQCSIGSEVSTGSFVVRRD